MKIAENGRISNVHVFSKTLGGHVLVSPNLIPFTQRPVLVVHEPWQGRQTVRTPFGSV